MNYNFDEIQVISKIVDHWKDWANEVGAYKFVLGVSGGKDSTVVACLAASVFGSKNVYGVMMPNGRQQDQLDAEFAIRFPGINRLECNIGETYQAMSKTVSRSLYRLADNGLTCRDDRQNLTENTVVNLPPRLRMSCLYAVAQTVGGFVLNTDNLSERLLGYFTAYGDGAGDYAPLRGLTATEVVQIGKSMNIPDFLILKTPGDGLQQYGDEQRFGFTYAELDKLIRTGEGSDDLRKKVMKRVKANGFKTQIVNIPGPTLDFLPVCI